METDDLHALLLVLEQGSFQGAAEASGLPRSNLRRGIDRLEEQFGPLLVRQNTGILPTPTGRLVASHAKKVVAQVAAMVSAAHRMETELHVRVAVGLPPHLMAVALAEVRNRLPHLRIVWTVTEDPVHAPGEVPDLILHFGPLPAGGSWISTVLMRTPERLVASPSYLQEHGVPNRLEDLNQHRILKWKAPGGDADGIPLLGGGSFSVTPAVVSTDIHFLRSLAAFGQGIALLPEAGLPKLDPAMELEPVLSEIVGRERAFSALVPAAVQLLPAGARLLDLLRDLSETLKGAERANLDAS